MICVSHLFAVSWRPTLAMTMTIAKTSQQWNGRPDWPANVRFGDYLRMAHAWRSETHLSAHSDGLCSRSRAHYTGASIASSCEPSFVHASRFSVA